MKSNLMKRSGLLLAAAMTAALLSIGAGGGAALAQTAGGSPASTEPFYKSALMGSAAPFIDVSENPGWLQGLSVSGFISNTTGMWVNSSAIRFQKNKNSLSHPARLGPVGHQLHSERRQPVFRPRLGSLRTAVSL